MKKRTKQIDDAREIVLPFSIDGKQAFTTVGSQEMQGHENEELSQNIKRQQTTGGIQKHVEGVMENAQRFLQATMWMVAPNPIKESLARCEKETATGDDMDRVTDWINEMQLVSVQDGLTTVVKSKGKVLADMKAKVDATLVKPIEVEIAKMFPKRGGEETE